MIASTNPKDFLWVEKYRPSTIADCILPDRIKKLASDIVVKGEVSNMLFFGGAGMGKTTLAKAICYEIGCDYIVINGSDENGIDVLRNKISNFATTISITGKPKVVIIDESDHLTPHAQPAFRNFIEENSRYCRFIFTCNYKEKLIPALHSRLVPIDFAINKDEKKKVFADFLARLIGIADAEGVQYESKQVIGLLLKKYFPDYRRTIGELQSIAMQNDNNITAGTLSLLSDGSIVQLFEHIKDKNFREMRVWVAQNNEGNVQGIYRQMFDTLSKVCEPSCIPNLILIIADYQYKSAFVADQEINLVACLTEIMASGEWL